MPWRPGVLAEEAKRLGALLVHYSTDYVFDGEKRSPYLETDTPNPLSHYALTKLEGERADRRERLPAPDPAHELGLRAARVELLPDHPAQGARRTSRCGWSTTRPACRRPARFSRRTRCRLLKGGRERPAASRSFRAGDALRVRARGSEGEPVRLESGAGQKHGFPGRGAAAGLFGNGQPQGSGNAWPAVASVAGSDPLAPRLAQGRQTGSNAPLCSTVEQEGALRKNSTIGSCASSSAIRRFRSAASPRNSASASARSTIV